MLRNGRVGGQVLVAVLLLAGCGQGEGGPSTPRLPDPSAVAGMGLTARADGGMIVSGNPFATRAGAEVMEEGGNAVDAAVAAAFTLAVVEPSQSGLGGRTQALVRSPDGSFRGVDGTTEVPRGYDPARAGRAEHGYATVAVPGTVAALTRIHEEFGVLPLERVMAPAVALAEEGFPLTEGEAERIAGVAEGLLEWEGARRYFLRPDGSPYEAGELLVQRDLAELLRSIAREGAAAFYRGEVAERIARDMAEHGGFVTTDDLAAYEARDAVVVRGRYRELEVVGTYLPASGATVVEILQILEELPLPEMDAPARMVAAARALLLGFQDRDSLQHLPPAEAVALLTSREWAAERARTIREPGSGGGMPPPASGFRGEAVRRRGPAAAGSPAGAVGEPSHTTHLSVADAEGWAVSMTQSLGPTMGSRVVTPGLGFVYAATTGGYLSATRPGERPWSSQAPLILLEGGVPRYVLGGAGARRILSALVCTVIRLVDEDRGLADALEAPRIHPGRTRVRVEAGPGRGFDPSILRALRAAGFRVEERAAGTYFARLNGIEILPEGGGFLGVADPRWRWGGAAGPSRR